MSLLNRMKFWQTRCFECRKRTSITFATADSHALCPDCWFLIEAPKMRHRDANLSDLRSEKV
jgi:ribosomal protein S27E